MRFMIVRKGEEKLIRSALNTLIEVSMETAAGGDTDSQDAGELREEAGEASAVVARFWPSDIHAKPGSVDGRGFWIPEVGNA